MFGLFVAGRNLVLEIDDKVTDKGAGGQRIR